MKNYLLVFLFALCVNQLHAQHFLDYFDKAHIITDHDTIACYVKVQGTYHAKFEYKLHRDADTLVANIDTVNYLITDFNSYGKIRPNNKSILSRIICWGKINYYARIQFASPKLIRGDHQNGVSKTDDWTTYYIEKQDTLIAVPKRKVAQKIAFLFDDDLKSLTKVMKMNKLNNEKLITIIENYNQGKQ
ncbi:hypothetical protein [Marinifilum caeruleilacunae]|uniref:DUF4468 domain-containing protein n=1 Tax=Marinifilum caeruleilacunae TaxID=2499076 RepID=A0ABX1WSE4_9BACT|nr:hypothetical protein [Marinifilum caeruleilacunae]NOU59019.1 hypothetical protein [Marinifilum caeruleilacunae]